MKRKNCKAAGSARERLVKSQMESEGWSVTRAPASIGVADLMAIKLDCRPRLIQVKANKGNPYMNFRPQERRELRAAAEFAGADPFLVWYPPHGEAQWIPSSEWPS